LHQPSATATIPDYERDNPRLEHRVRHTQHLRESMDFAGKFRFRNHRPGTARGLQQPSIQLKLAHRLVSNSRSLSDGRLQLSDALLQILEPDIPSHNLHPATAVRWSVCPCTERHKRPSALGEATFLLQHH